MITLDEYKLWIREHIEAYGFSDLRKASEQFMRWFDVFECYSLEDLRSATAWLLRGEENVPIISQRQALLRAIRSVRESRLKTNTYSEDVQEYGSCELCCNSGWVVVPRWDCLRDGEWLPKECRYCTCAVACRCAVGNRNYSSKEGRKPLTLDSYERRYCPNWKQLMIRRRIEDKAARQHVDLEPGQVNFKRFIRRLQDGELSRNGQPHPMARRGTVHPRRQNQDVVRAGP